MFFPRFLFGSVLLLGLVATLSAANAPYVKRRISSQTLEKAGATTTLDLDGVFALADVTGPLMEFSFTGGKMYLELFPDVAPVTVANFLRYADNFIYDSTFIHRSVPGFVIQAGGYQIAPDLPHVPTYEPISNEFQLSNLPGTMAMAKLGGDLNSATSEWFVNLAANTFLDAEDQKFTVFGKLIGGGLQFCQSIAALRIIDNGRPFNELPVVNYSGGEVLLSNLLKLQTVRRAELLKFDSTVPGYLALTATTSDASIALPELISTGLKVTTGANEGDATITIVATDYYGQPATTTFVTHSVAPAATPAPVISFGISLRPHPSTYGLTRTAGTYASGTMIAVKAYPKTRRRFKNWTENGVPVSWKASYSFRVTKRRVLVANFVSYSVPAN